jgi:uncharacterized OB-fold protein
LKRPAPAPTALSEPFWEAARNGRLAIQRCRSCHRYSHPPGPVCPRCQGADLGWDEVSGRGTIHQCTVMHQPLVRGFEAAVPYACVAVELEEQPGLLVVANLLGAPPTAAKVGLAVEVEFEEIAGGFRLPQFRLAGEPAC